MKVNSKNLAKFLVKAKKSTYASKDSMGISTERPGFHELEYEDKNFYYRDSYAGYFQAPGMEVVRIGGKKGKPIWTMAYSGGMVKGFQKDVKFAQTVFGFLKNALQNVPEASPFRGPKKFKEGGFCYENDIHGDITNFYGEERIFHNGRIVFRQFYCGSNIIDK